jgi:hypothetical protein
MRLGQSVVRIGDRSRTGSPGGHRCCKVPLAFTLASSEFVFGRTKRVHRVRVRQDCDGFLERLKIVDSEEHRSGPAVHSHCHTLVLTTKRLGRCLAGGEGLQLVE